MTSAPPSDAGPPMVHLVDDEDVVRDAVAWLLRSRRILSTDHASGEAFLAELTPAADDWPGSPCCLLLDLRMGGMSGIALFEELMRRGLAEAMPVILLTGHGDVPTAVATVKRGAFDFVEKPFSDDSLVDRVELALAASARTLAARRERALRLKGLARLNEREHAVMLLVAEGLPDKRIADRLHLGVRTIEVYRAQVFDKLEVDSAAALANLLNRHAG